MRRLLVPAMVCLAALAGCERPEATSSPESPAAPAAEARFRHRLGGDISGDYRPTGDPSGAWRVDGLFIGQVSAFDAWAAGRRDASPLILTLSGPSGKVQVLPRAYDLTDQTLHMVGAMPDGTNVTLDARIDQGALATARRNLGDRTPVVVGAATVGEQRLSFSLGWWNGD
ncbi:hypothetical protein [Brevundimonas sp.]|jgi:hypothetical protein|uniref:hypothetical protein n=1 Tax=Brevundimonas sp. TaxID=1871086 RepID=UPI0037C1176B